MKCILKIGFLILFSNTLSAQKQQPEYTFCGKIGNCIITWDEFINCKKELTTLDKSTSVGSFLLTISKVSKKDSIQIEYPAKGNVFSKSSMESIKKLREEKKLGSKLVIDHVQILQSGKEARTSSGMIIILN